MAKGIPYIAGMGLTDCGPACLAMVLAHHGRHVPLSEVRDATGTGRDGSTAAILVNVARRYGLQARAVRADIDDLCRLPQGSILHWEFNHFVVFDRWRRGTAEIIDPRAGRTRVPAGQLHQSYTGVAITLEPTPTLSPRGRAPKGLFRYLRPLLAQSRNLRRILVTSLLLRVFSLAVPLLTATLVNRTLPDGHHHLLAVLVTAMCVLTGYHFITAFLRSRLLLQLRTDLDLQMTLGFMGHLVDLPYAFFLQRSAGDLMMRLKSNSVIRESLANGAISTLLDGGLATLYLVVLFALSPPIGALALTLGGLQAALLVAARKRNRQLMAEGLQAEARSQGYVYQLLAGIESLKAAGAERRGFDHWTNLYIAEVSTAVKRGRLSALVDSALASFRFGSPLAVLAIGGYQVLDGALSVGTMLGLVAVAAGFLEPLTALVITVLDLQRLASYFERINDVLDTPTEQASQNPRKPGHLSGRITAEAVTFRYNGFATPAVHDISLEIRPGQSVAIVGPSASGKSTLAHLLLGLYQPESGTVRYDGVDLSAMDTRSVRQQLGIVTQNAYVFGASIRDNIALADPSAPFEAVVRAAALACIDADITALPMGYETPLIDAGASLSGGQRQRIALARALVHEPSILLLDEATSALDPITERQVYDNLAQLGCTRIMIAHSLRTLAHADLIVVMNHGTIAEQGTHDDLMILEGLYHRLVSNEAGVS
ncbi:peptidase domain-containing ABC transporter [Streptomyces sp. NBC_00289]|uniref:peptidase domain-containing ABC transporter n=1 Tax=Streptomyces sp. NBC_00289 TaxID=2975703 RepID=UPI0032458FDA